MKTSELIQEFRKQMGEIKGVTIFTPFRLGQFRVNFLNSNEFLSINFIGNDKITTEKELNTFIDKVKQKNET